ncbi:hypothetical protein EZJ19_03865 [Parasulfuritortus cantonensis]|uniref:Uncharacterized protein n=1 Tax=Parasulfuritortus cantonensis TaxID=2528202 RepID=A0A4R1BIL4_9PROT|nr:hypothetical protein [Parasulfuritortus cantonensis]TCJ17094.1 hypothetical protein EZJ19_03865 [Parasulfuritortus cantonensis]
MDLSIPSNVAYSPQAQVVSQVGGARTSQGTLDATDANASRQRQPTDTRETGRQNAARAANDTARTATETEVARSRGYEFDYEESRRVVKVNDSKGVLIYQVPSKGRLALIEAEDKAASNAQALRLIA